MFLDDLMQKCYIMYLSDIIGMSWTLSLCLLQEGHQKGHCCKPAWQKHGHMFQIVRLAWKAFELSQIRNKNPAHRPIESCFFLFFSLFVSADKQIKWGIQWCMFSLFFPLQFVWTRGIKRYTFDYMPQGKRAQTSEGWEAQLEEEEQQRYLLVK